MAVEEAGFVVGHIYAIGGGGGGGGTTAEV